ncbi:MAG TPA: amidohydrolase family protein [Acidimicrobiales bacterium]|jgi:predicted TIM-barrel fold metal-dependent hydrolase|nr:amidohydrolase family protein [Acidimicrobiales bacterium]
MSRVVISADSHTMEPADMWTSRLDGQLRDQAPQVRKNIDAPGYSFHAPGLPPSKVSGAWGAGRSGEELKQHLEHAGYESARPSGWDPAERLKDQDIDGVHAEVLYGTLAMRLFPIADGGLQLEFFRVYNDWLAEYCAYEPKRLHGLGLISLWDVDQGVRELERCAALGLKGAMIWGYPPKDRPYHSPIYDRLWAAAQDLEQPLSLHIVTGMGEESKVDFTDAPIRYMHMIHEVQRSLSQLVLGGVLERFPRLMIVGAECETGWLPHWMQRMDHANAKFGAMMQTPLTMQPSDYIRRQVWLTFMDDPVGAASYGVIGADTFMWGNDFPHTDSTWPNSRTVIEKNFTGVPQGIADKILRDNAVELYHIDLS